MNCQFKWRLWLWSSQSPKWASGNEQPSVWFLLYASSLEFSAFSQTPGHISRTLSNKTEVGGGRRKETVGNPLDKKSISSYLITHLPCPLTSKPHSSGATILQTSVLASFSCSLQLSDSIPWSRLWPCSLSPPHLAFLCSCKLFCLYNETLLSCKSGF